MGCCTGWSRRDKISDADNCLRGLITKGLTSAEKKNKFRTAKRALAGKWKTGKKENPTQRKETN